MSAAHSSEPDMNPVIDGVVGRSLPGTLNVVSLGMIATGVAAFGTGLFAMGDGGVVAWGAFLVGVLYTLAISQGGVLFSVVQTATWGRCMVPSGVAGQRQTVATSTSWRK